MFDHADLSRRSKPEIVIGRAKGRAIVQRFATGTFFDKTPDSGVAFGQRAVCSFHRASVRRPAGATTSANESTWSFETSWRITEPSERAIGRAPMARAAAELSISP